MNDEKAYNLETRREMEQHKRQEDLLVAAFKEIEILQGENARLRERAEKAEKDLETLKGVLRASDERRKLSEPIWDARNSEEPEL